MRANCYNCLIYSVKHGDSLMWISDSWVDYELLDCSGGEKLERWGQHTLVRPDPQVIWQTPKEHPGWENPDARYVRSQSGGGRWDVRSRESGVSGHGTREIRGQKLGVSGQGTKEIRGRELGARGQGTKDTCGGELVPRIPDRWRVSYDSLKFNVSLMNFKHTGLFPEQAVNWGYIEGKIRAAKRKISVLNLFAYTGGATLAAAAAGASVCHVDAARGMVARARENAGASGLADAPIRWIVDDCALFVQREIRRGRRYDALIMDPPTYGRGPGGEVWKLEDGLYDFVRLCAGILSDDPLFVLINSYTAGLSPTVLSYVTQSLLGGYSESGELGLPVTAGGLTLPCGASCRWEPGAV